MTEYHKPPIEPMAITFDADKLTLSPEGPTLVRRMSDLEGLFADQVAWKESAESENPIVYSVVSTPIPEINRELPQSITTIQPGELSGEFWMTKGHQHPDHQGEIYLGLKGTGGLLLFDGTNARWIEMKPGTIGYMPPGWAHRSVNTGNEPYSFLAVYPGGAGHDYGWVLKNGLGYRVFRDSNGEVSLRDYFANSAS